MLSDKVYFDKFSFSFSERRLWDESTRLEIGAKLQRKTQLVLAYFLRNPVRPIEKQELLDAVWGGSAVSDQVLTNQIVKLRDFFEAQGCPNIIETRHTFGFMWLAPTSPTRPSPTDVVPEIGAPNPSSSTPASETPNVVSTSPSAGGSERLSHADLVDALWSFDLWTPGRVPQDILRRFSDEFGEETAGSIVMLSNASIEAVGRGDFHQLRDIADQAIDLGNCVPDSPVAGEGLYLRGEALRLMADFEPDRAVQRQLRTEAEQSYGLAEERLRGDPRPIRGRARLIEVAKDLDTALDEFDRATAVVAVRSLDRRTSLDPSLAHEQIRTLRHRIACLATMHDEAPSSTLEARRRAREIRRLLHASEPSHSETLSRFQESGDWWRIEWFMALVLHAKAWVSIDERTAAARRLEWALRLRAQMMPDHGPLSTIELGNLDWWARAARSVREVFEAGQQTALDALLASIDLHVDRHTIHQAIKEFIRAGEAPY